MSSNKLIAIVPFFLSIASATAWADHSPGHDSVARDGVVDLQQHVNAGNRSRIAADEALQQQIDALKAETTLTDVGNCPNGDVAKSNGAGGWHCAPDSVSNPESQTLGDLECMQEGDIAVFSGGQWTCHSKIPSPLRFVDNGDGTITDNETGLMWEKKLSETETVCLNGDQTLRDARCVQNEYSWTGDGDGGTMPNGTLFTDFLARLNLGVAVNGDATCFANHCDWRIPNIQELQTILLEEYLCRSRPCINVDVFGPTKADGYWSSTSHIKFPTDAWHVIFTTGIVLQDFKDDFHFVRAVRRAR